MAAPEPTATVAREPHQRSLRSSVDMHWKLSAVLVGYVALSVWYGLVVPVWEAPEESEHLQYVHFLATQHRLPERLPTLLLSGFDESHQPPLYYLLGALLTGWAQPPALPEVQLNPYATWPDHPARFAIAAHSPLRDGWPFDGAVLVTHVLRLFSTVLGLVTILATYRLISQLLPSRPELALLASGSVAFLPGFVFSSATVNNDGLLIALSSLAALLTLGAASNNPRRVPRFVILALVLGLAVAAKLSGLVAMGAVVLSRARRDLASLSSALLISALPLAVALAWATVRAWAPTLLGRPGLLPALDIGPADATALVVNLTRTFIGALGRSNVLLPDELYASLAVLGIIPPTIALLRYPDRLLVARLAAWPVLAVLAVTLRWAIPGDRVGSDSGRYLYLALVPMAALLALGWATLPRALGGWLARLLPLALLLTTLAAPPLVIRPAYAFRDVIATFVSATVEPGARPLDLAVDPGLRLVGFALAPSCPKPGDVVRAQLFWRADDGPRSIGRSALFLRSSSWPLTHLSERDPGHNLYPPPVWLPQEIVRDDHEFWLASHLPPGEYELGVAFVPEHHTGSKSEDLVIFTRLRVGLDAIHPGCPST